MSFSPATHSLFRIFHPMVPCYPSSQRSNILTSIIPVSKYLAAYLLLNAAGSTPSADSIKSVLESVGIEVEESQVSALLEALDGKSVEELIAEGNEKLASVPTGGAGAASGSAPAAGAAEEAAAEAEEEAAEESDDDMGFGLFD